MSDTQKIYILFNLRSTAVVLIGIPGTYHGSRRAHSCGKPAIDLPLPYPHINLGRTAGEINEEIFMVGSKRVTLRQLQRMFHKAEVEDKVIVYLTGQKTSKLNAGRPSMMSLIDKENLLRLLRQKKNMRILF